MARSSWSPSPDRLESTAYTMCSAATGSPMNATRPSRHPAASCSAAAGREDASLPVARVRDGKILIDPSNRDLAAAFGVATELGENREFDVAVVGAGPAGLAAAVYASSEGMRALVVERESIGGQAGSSSLIRNYLGFAHGVSGAELAQRAYQQAWVFGTSFLLMREVTELIQGSDQHRLRIGEDEVRAHAVVLATGVSYRRLEIPALARLEGSGVFYGAPAAEAKALIGKRAAVVGGGNSAGQAAVHLSRFAEQVTIVVRGGSLAESMSDYLRKAIAAADNIDVRLGTEVVDGEGEGRLQALTLRDRGSGKTSTAPFDALFVMIGAQPGTDWLPPEIERDDWGYVLCGRDAGGDLAERERRRMLETSLRRVFAVGDVRHGATKRVASAVGEGSVVIQQLSQCLESKDEAHGPMGIG